MHIVRTRRVMIAGCAVALAAAVGWGAWTGLHPRPAPSVPPAARPETREVPGPSADDEGIPQVAGVRSAVPPSALPQGGRSAPQGPSSDSRPIARRTRPAPPAQAIPRVESSRGISHAPATSPSPPARQDRTRQASPPSAPTSPPAPQAQADVAPGAQPQRSTPAGSDGGGAAPGGVGGAGSTAGRGGGPRGSEANGAPSDEAGPRATPRGSAPSPVPRLTPPRVLTSAGADYPLDAFRLTVRRQDLGSALAVDAAEGTVGVRALVLAAGTVTRVDVTVSSGSAALDRAATEAVKRWLFAPATRDGVPIDAYVTLRIRYVVR